MVPRFAKIGAVFAVACAPAEDTSSIVDTDTDTSPPPSQCTPRADGWVTDSDPHAEPALPALAAAGDRVVDPTFGATIVRITDADDGASCTNGYSYWRAFSADSKHLAVACDGRALLYDFDPVTATASGQRDLFATTTPEGTTPGSEDAIWSASANVLFAHDTVRLWRLDVAAETWTLVKDFSAVVGDGHIRQMSASDDDGTFAFTTQDADWSVTGAIVWRSTDDRVRFELAQPDLDEVQVDKSGEWLVVKTGQQGADAVEVRIVEVATGVIVDLTDDGPDFAPGHSDNGDGVVVGADNWTNRFTVRSLAAPRDHASVLDLGGDWVQDAHVSLRADDPTWASLSFYESGAHTSGRFHNEIVLVATDGSQRVRRLAHHRSQVADYWDSPRAVMSRDGCFATFTSTWGDSGRRDVFVLALASP